MPTLKLGIICSLDGGARQAFEKASSLGLEGVQLACWNPQLYTDQAVEQTLAAADEFNIEINTVWAGAPGDMVWNFTEGPLTIGIVPRENRDVRVAGLIAGADFAKRIGVKSITTHVGFIPEDPNRDLYGETVENLKRVAGHCGELGLDFWFETGQETPTTLLRTIEDIGLDNLGINLDPANLVMYGKANPVDALDVFGKYVRGIHAKDGIYPTTGRTLGKEVALGEGKVDFPTLIGRLKTEFGFAGHLTIEREISGDQQTADIRRAIEMLRPMCG
jgi:sugar phosphate isomerase/epimerase